MASSSGSAHTSSRARSSSRPGSRRSSTLHAAATEISSSETRDAGGATMPHSSGTVVGDVTQPRGSGSGVDLLLPAAGIRDRDLARLGLRGDGDPKGQDAGAERV